jgi:sugar O-acyltransferase (sialic acid O-acetyltransferase NeuD family)
MIKAEILVPLLNANEPEARLVGIHVKDGQPVDKGALLFTLETTKAAADVDSTENGYVRLMAREGDILSVGDRLALITESLDESLESSTVKPGPTPKFESQISAFRITKPARALAEQMGLDLSLLPLDQLVTVAVVRQIANSSTALIIPDVHYKSDHILIYGAGGHAKAVMEMVQAIGTFQIAGILDDKVPAGTRVLDIPVLGPREIIPQLVERGLHQAANGVGGIIDINIRVKLFELLENLGLVLPRLIHPRAAVEPSASVGDGVQVFANAYVGSAVVLQPKCMINTNAVVSHDCEIGSYTHIAPGALLAGHVHVGERSLIGMGVTTAIGIKIGNGVRIGNGAVIYADVPDRSIIPAGKVWAGKD